MEAHGRTNEPRVKEPIDSEKPIQDPHALPQARPDVNRPDANQPGGKKPTRGPDPDKPGGRY